MGFLDRAIKNGISNGINKGLGEAVSKAVGESVKNIIQPKVNEAAANYTNAVTGSINEAAKEINEASASMNDAAKKTEEIDTAELEKAFNLLGSMATNAVKDKKVCPKCGELAEGDKQFCPQCGTKLPELTLSQYAVCPECGKQNDIGTKFCASCGAKLPLVIEEENSAKAADEAFMANWDEQLADYPKWCFGGRNFSLEENGTDENGIPNLIFSVSGVTSADLEKYCALLKQNGFVRPEGFYTDEVLYKVVNGVCRAFGTTEAFCDDDTMSVGFYAGDYNKPKEEPKTGKKGGLLGGLFGI